MRKTFSMPLILSLSKDGYCEIAPVVPFGKLRAGYQLTTSGSHNASMLHTI
jgi:hypothetical protein